jgi:hypothetical protein
MTHARVCSIRPPAATARSRVTAFVPDKRVVQPGVGHPVHDRVEKRAAQTPPPVIRMGADRFE